MVNSLDGLHLESYEEYIRFLETVSTQTGELLDGLKELGALIRDKHYNTLTETVGDAISAVARQINEFGMSFADMASQAMVRINEDQAYLNDQDLERSTGEVSDAAAALRDSIDDHTPRAEELEPGGNTNFTDEDVDNINKELVKVYGMWENTFSMLSSKAGELENLSTQDEFTKVLPRFSDELYTLKGTIEEQYGTIRDTLDKGIDRLNETKQKNEGDAAEQASSKNQEISQKFQETLDELSQLPFD